MRFPDIFTNLAKDFGVALVLLSRWPIRIPDSAFEHQARAIWAFPVVGLALGATTCLLFAFLMQLGVPIAIAAILVAAFSTLQIGAMHEDGLADCADGFWGGFTRERRLEIMKDSSIGAYGMLMLIFAIALRILCFIALAQNGAITAILAAAVLSRGVMASVMSFLPMAKSNGLAASVGMPAKQTGIVALVIGLGFAVYLTPLIACIAALITAFLWSKVAQSKIGGQTGDVLGASQQISELSFLVICTAL